MAEGWTLKEWISFLLAVDGVVISVLNSVIDGQYGYVSSLF